MPDDPCGKGLRGGGGRGVVSVVKMRFAGNTPDHHGLYDHEPRPVATNGVDQSAAIGAHAGQDVLVENEEWLDGADLCVAVADGEVQIIELGMDRVLYDFVVAAVLVLRSKCPLPLRALSQLTARDDLDAGHRSVAVRLGSRLSPDAPMHPP